MNFLSRLKRRKKIFERPDKTFIGTDYALFYFYPNQPFYFYELYLPEPPHLLKSWYCNVNALPQRTPDGYSFIDLDLDIWLYPDLTSTHFKNAVTRIRQPDIRLLSKGNVI